MKAKLSLLILLFCSVTMTAETYSIVFKSGNGSSDSGTNVNELTKIILSATDNCVESVVTANNIYNAGSGKGIKGGKGSAKGELTIRLNTAYAISTMTVYAASYPHKNDTAAQRGILVCGKELIWEENHKAELYPYTISIDSTLSDISIAAKVASNNRWYVQKIEFEAPDPLPNTAVFEMPYMVDFGSVPVEAGEVSEDVVSINVLGKHVVEHIHLSLKSGTVFSLSEYDLPTQGGEVDIAYSLSFTGTVHDTLYVSGIGTDQTPVTQTMPFKISGYAYTPPAYTLDTTRMAVGPMPGDYYKYAQHTSDSTLKNHLGYIICCGKRYRYGSGSHRSWDAFFSTDRDTLTNEVLDMYSNNVRYFNPANPTTSVAGFDIEHMLPKSWWGGDVNPAYCDIFHLVPGDASANRSKSNHAPGVPADSSFFNGSFVTGRDTIHGLTRVFCPADEYKGDFARAYFYIATCYGDSLQWVEKGEPAQAMTNEGWQEFLPWLRDLLLEWHRLDPVSQKELDRAVEVNKIQGNRNPFIDYPELAEYIWGNKQGEEVDFYMLVQSYGDPYNDQPEQGIDNTAVRPSARKEIRDGQLVIIRNSTIYTPLGQAIR